MDLPRPTPAELRAFRELGSQLLEWAPTLEGLVWERIRALQEAHGPRNHPLETDEEFAMRVLAVSQEPFPLFTYDSDGGPRHFYEHIDVGYGDASDTYRVTFTGNYPEFAADMQSYQVRRARIYCQSWLMTDPDGIDRFKAETAKMVEAVKVERAELRTRLDAAVASMVAERPAETGTG